MKKSLGGVLVIAVGVALGMFLLGLVQKKA
jgi:hypothetical protein